MAHKPFPKETPEGYVMVLLNVFDQGLNVISYSKMNPLLYNHSLVVVCAISGEVTDELNKNTLVFDDGK